MTRSSEDCAIVSRAKRSDWSGVAALSREIFTAAPLSEEILAWKYDRPGFPPTAAKASLASDGRTVGFYGGIPVSLTRGGRIIPAAQGADIMVAAAARRGLARRGTYVRLFEKMRDAAIESLGAALVFGFASRVAFGAGERLLGYRRFGSIRQWTLDLSAARKIEPLRPSILPESAADLWRAAAPECGTAVHRDRDYIEWRYLKRPDANYLFFHADGGPGKPGAFIAVSLFGGARILEFFAQGAAPDLNEWVLLRAASYLAGRGFTRIRAWFPEWSAPAAALLKAGASFEDLEEPVHAAAIFDAAAFGPEDGRFFYSMGDADHW